MKFNEKLMELRRKAGLSQEELGEKLKVTRQTISKWELGETTPEMTKLKEMANIFHVSVDDLLDEEENPIKTSEPIQEKTQEKTNWRPIIIIGILVIVLLYCVYYVATLLISNKILENFSFPFFSKEKMTETFDNGLNTAQSIIEQAQNMQEDITEKYQHAKEEYNEAVANEEEDFNNMYQKMNSLVEEATKEQEKEMENKTNKTSHNSTLESLYTGVIEGNFVKSALNKVISINQKDDKKIEVTYAGKTTKEATGIANISSKLGDFTKYLVTYEYDDEGYINKMKISKV